MQAVTKRRNVGLCQSSTSLPLPSLANSTTRNTIAVLPATRHIQHRVSPVCAVATTMPASKKYVSDSYVSQKARNALFGTATEQVSEVEASLQGSLPAWLQGDLLLNGCGDFRGMKHLFDGYAMISKMRIAGGRVWGSQRYLQSQAYGHFKSTGNMKYREFGTPIPTRGIVDKAAKILENVGSLILKQGAFSDNASVNLVPLRDGSVLALSEASPAAYRLDPGPLATLGQVTYSDSVVGDLTTAHPKVLPDGTLVNFTRSLPGGGFHVFTQDRTTLKRTQIAFIRDRHAMAPGWVHDMALSAHHIIICEMPIFFNMPSLLLGTERSYVFMDWNGQEGTRVHVVALDGSGVQTFAAPPFFTFHFANAFEMSDGKQLAVDMAVYSGPEILNDLLLERMMAFPGKEVSRSHLRRLTIPLTGSKPAQLAAPAPLLLDEESHGAFCEFPIINPAYSGRPYRYAYALSAVRPTNMGNALGKYDLQEGTCQLWHEPGCSPGEPVFVPAPGGSSEDDGVVLVNVMGASGTSFLLVLDARDLRELARATLPYAVPYRFHGTFVPLKA